MNEFGNIKKMLEQSGKAGQLMDVMSSAEGRRIESTVDGEALARAVASGDVRSMEEMLRRVLNTGEGRALAEKIAGIMEK